MSRRKRPERRAGSNWRVLAWEMLPGDKSGKGFSFGSTETVASDGPLMRKVPVPGTDLDEVVIGSWLHLEQMDTGVWWMNVGGLTIHVRASVDGKPLRVTVDGPGDYDDPVPGCAYTLRWSGEDEIAAA